jgi:hypothetical protein
MRTIPLLLSSVGCLSLLLALGLAPNLHAEDAMSVTHDKDKTVYTIGSDETHRQENAKERDRAWDMLKNMSIHVDKDQGDHHQSQPSGSDDQSNRSPQTGK